MVVAARESARTQAEAARGIASSADYLSAALASGLPDDIEMYAVDLVAAYDQYRSPESAAGARLGFDELMTLPYGSQREEGMVMGLANVLIDLQVAAVLGGAARATAEPSAESAADLNEANDALALTLQAVGASAQARLPAGQRFGFEELRDTQSQVTVNSHQPTTRSDFQTQAVAFYDRLLAETSALLVMAFKGASGIDPARIGQGLEALGSTGQPLPGGALAERCVEAVSRAVGGLRALVGAKSDSELQQDLAKILAEISRGQDAMQLFLKYCYGYDTGQRRISEMLRTSKASESRLAAGRDAVSALESQMAEAFVLSKRMVTVLDTARRPMTWVLSKVGGTAPVDLLVSTALMLIVDVALLRGMDYADTARVIRFVDGIIAVSTEYLG